ncbi:hypothetical protein GIB67_029858 [Kingdonia uniflora]|uniref:Glabrous enhancer-binding protein-like DBD domain-containing protein n=1 Tax=Kingdonia uniflora TaxID=39325 RepID=A0A7J7NJP6_9MAGN|nr:hypothetical protein GIB67_029858 [Kingdonia uniflora]
MEPIQDHHHEIDLEEVDEDDLELDLEGVGEEGESFGDDDDEDLKPQIQIQLQLQSAPLQPLSNLPQTITNPSQSSSSLEKKPSLFQRLWTDEDEIELLQGFLDYTIQRGYTNSSYHHDTGPFYDQIKNKLQLDFNKNQLVEKLRRLKKKFRNAMKRVDNGKDLIFKSPHDQAAFEISRKIWSGSVVGVEDEDVQMNPSEIDNNGGVGVVEKSRGVRKRLRKVAFEENVSHRGANVNVLECTPVSSSVSNVIEDTVKSCLSPLFKELLSSVVNVPCNLRGLGLGLGGGMGFNLGENLGMNLMSNGEVLDEKWRQQQILELEVYAKRMELVQDQIKLALEELRLPGS